MRPRHLVVLPQILLALACLSCLSPAHAENPGQKTDSRTIDVSLCEDGACIAAYGLQRDPGAFAARLAHFIWVRDGLDRKSFVSSKLATIGTYEKRLAGLLKAWIQDQKPGDLGPLYYAIGPEDPGNRSTPAWFKGLSAGRQAILRQAPAKYEELLLARLDAWNSPAKQLSIPEGKAEAAAGPVLDWVLAFMPDAIEKAKNIPFGKIDPRTEAEIDAKFYINRPNIPGMGGGGAVGGGSAAGGKRVFYPGNTIVPASLEQAFGRVGDDDVLCLRDQGTSPANCATGENVRYISVRLVLQRVDGKLKYMIEVADPSAARANPRGSRSSVYYHLYDPSKVTDKKDVYEKICKKKADGRTCETDEDGDPVVERVEKIRFQLKANGDIAVSSLDGTPAVNSLGASLTLAKLAQKRSDHAFELGETVRIGDKVFFVMPESIGKGCFQFIPAQGTGIENECLGCVSKMECGGGGCSETMRDSDMELCKVGDKDYKLIYQPIQRKWLIAEGKGEPDDAPPPAPPSAKKPDAGDGKNPQRGGGAPACKGDTKLPEQGWPDQVCSSLNQAGYTLGGEAKALNAQIDKSLDARLYVRSDDSADKDPNSKWLFASHKLKDSFAFVPIMYEVKGKDIDFQGLDIADKDRNGWILRVKNSMFEVFYDLTSLKIDDKNNLMDTGQLESTDKSVAFEFPNSLALLSYLTDRFFPDKREMILGRALQVLKDPKSDWKFTLILHPEKELRLTLSSGAQRWLYPQGGGKGEPPIPESARGATGSSSDIAFDRGVPTAISVVGAQHPLGETLFEDESFKRVFADNPADPSAALYYGIDDESGAKVEKWVLRFKISDQSTHRVHLSAASKSHPVFMKSPKRRTTPPDMGAVRVGGLNVPSLPSETQISVQWVDAYGRGVRGGVAGSKGALGAYGPAGKQSGCLGVVLWWGVSREEAEAACHSKD